MELFDEKIEGRKSCGTVSLTCVKSSVDGSLTILNGSDSSL
jgi:hypothetical protein